MEEVLKEAKKNFTNSTLDKLSCRWCGSPSLGNLTEVEYLFIECQECGFTFCPYISQEFMEKLYTQGYHAKGGNVPKKGWTTDNTMVPVLDLYPSDSQLKILDFGCGQSVVPDQLREMGHQVTGVDMAEPVRPHPDRLTGNILELKLPKTALISFIAFRFSNISPNHDRSLLSCYG